MQLQFAFKEMVLLTAETRADQGVWRVWRPYYHCLLERSANFVAVEGGGGGEWYLKMNRSAVMKWDFKHINITNGYGGNKLNRISRALASSRGERIKRVEPAQTFECSEIIKFRTDGVMSPRQRRLQAPFRGP